MRGPMPRQAAAWHRIHDGAPMPEYPDRLCCPCCLSESAPRGLTRIGLAAVVATLLAATSLLPAQRPTVPPPESVFGFKVGADSQLFDYEQSMTYFRRLAAAAPARVKIFEVGRTSYGRTMHIVVISSPANLARLDRY